MNSLTKNLLVAVVFIFSLPFAKAQSLSERIIIGHGFSLYTDFFRGPSVLSEDSSYIYTTSGISLFTYTLNSRFILKELSNNTSFSLDIPVSLGISASDNGLGSLIIPVMLGFNHGNVSGYSSDKNKGVVLGFGAQYINSALVKSGSYSDKGLKTSWIEPVFNIGYRYWNVRNKAKEINLKVGYLPGNTFQDKYNSDEGSTGSFSIRLAFIVYPKY